MEERREAGGVERLRQVDRKQGLRLVDQEAAVAVGGRDERVPGLGGERQRPPDQLFGAVEQLAQGRAVEPVQDQHLRPRQQGGVELERGILGGGADEDDGAVLDIGQEAVLLGAVEAVDLVHEQQGLSSHLHMLARFGEHLLEIRDAREDGRDGDEAHADGVGEQPGDRRLAGSGRPPQHHRGELARRHHPPDRAFRPGEMVLPHHLVERARPQTVGERRTVRRRGGGRRRRRRIAGEQIGHGGLLGPV